MTTVLTYGTFDLFHVGHVRLLKRISEFGDHLIVACSTDEFNALKGKKSIFSYAERAEILMSCKYVSQVIPEENWEQKIEDVKKYRVDVFAMGDDWAGKFDFLQDYTRVVYLPRTEGVSTTQVKEVVAAIRAEKKQQLVNAGEHLLSLLKEL
ncbi:MAG: glycerol-3-phosphate cytidylyltransferase [Chromatiaceae bacterium]|nr:glycerol-3-phosphate cytidylyltransferase [Chromatiaceae bacterium]